MCPSQTLVDNNRAKFMNCQDFLTRYGIFKQFLLNTTVQYTLCQTYTKELLYSTSRKMINVRTTGRPKFIRAKSSARLLCCVQGLYLNRLRPRREPGRQNGSWTAIKLENPESISWGKIYLKLFLCTSSSKLRNFQLKFVYWRIEIHSYPIH